MPTLLPFAPRPPYPAETTREKFRALTLRYTNKPQLSEGWQATITGLLQKLCQGENGRHSVLMYLTGKTTSKALGNGEWWALYAWLAPHHLGDDCGAYCNQSADVWHYHAAVPQEIASILTARLVEMGQTEMFETGAWEVPVELKQREW